MLKRAIQIFPLLSISFVLASLSYTQQQSVLPVNPSANLTNDDVVKMVDAKLPDVVIVGKIRRSEARFDTSPNMLVKLKTAGVSDTVIQAMVEAGEIPATSSGKVPAVSVDANDPLSPHEPGIYWLAKDKQTNRIVRLESSSYSGTQTGGVITSGLTMGLKKAKWKAVLPGPHAALRVAETTPQFWFYFGEKSEGLGQSSAEPSKPEAFVLAKMDAGKEDRQLVVGQASVLGQSSGTRQKDAMPVSVEKASPGVYKVTPKKPLDPGEYCFVPPGGAVAFGMAGGRLFDFGIEGAQ